MRDSLTPRDIWVRRNSEKCIDILIILARFFKTIRNSTYLDIKLFTPFISKSWSRVVGNPKYFERHEKMSSGPVTFSTLGTGKLVLRLKKRAEQRIKWSMRFLSSSAMKIKDIIIRYNFKLIKMLLILPGETNFWYWNDTGTDWEIIVKISITHSSSLEPAQRNIKEFTFMYN